MGRSEQYMSQNKTFTRFELEGEGLVITETQKPTRYRNKDYPTVRIRWKGLHLIKFGEEEFLADESMIFDAGPKLGVSIIVVRHPEVPYTEEERATGREEIRRRMEEIFHCRCFWNEEGASQHVGEAEEKSPPAV